MIGAFEYSFDTQTFKRKSAWATNTWTTTNLDFVLSVRQFNEEDESLALSRFPIPKMESKSLKISENYGFSPSRIRCNFTTCSLMPSV
jgi:hypothetical protein